MIYDIIFKGNTGMRSNIKINRDLLHPFILCVVDDERVVKFTQCFLSVSHKSSPDDNQFFVYAIY